MEEMIRNYLTDLLNKYREVLKEEQANLEALESEEEQARGLMDIYERMKGYKRLIPRIIFCVCMLLFLGGITLTLGGMIKTIFSCGFCIYGLLVSGAIIITKKNYNNCKKELMKSDWDMEELLKETEHGHTKLERKYSWEILHPITIAKEKIADCQEFMLVLWDILQSDDLYKKLDEYSKKYGFTKMVFDHEWNSYLEEVSKAKPGKIYFSNNIPPEFKQTFDKEEKLTRKRYKSHNLSIN